MPASPPVLVSGSGVFGDWIGDGDIGDIGGMGGGGPPAPMNGREPSPDGRRIWSMDGRMLAADGARIWSIEGRMLAAEGARMRTGSFAGVRARWSVE